MAARKKTASKAKRTSAKKPAAARKHKAVKPKKTAIKRATAKRASAHGAVKKATGAISVGKKPFTKSQFISTISERTAVPRKDVVAIMESIGDIISAHIEKQGPEIFSWPGLFKIQVLKKPATKARQGINPFTGEQMMFKAKPASRKIKIRALKQLKEMAR